MEGKENIVKHLLFLLYNHYLQYSHHASKLYTTIKTLNCSRQMFYKSHKKTDSLVRNCIEKIPFWVKVNMYNRPHQCYLNPEVKGQRWLKWIIHLQSSQSLSLSLLLVYILVCTTVCTYWFIYWMVCTTVYTYWYVL